MLHYHIRWSSKSELDWDRFDSPEEAEASASRWVRSSETYIIEERGNDCLQCGALSEKYQQEKQTQRPANAMQRPTTEPRRLGSVADHNERGEPEPPVKYPWQKLVLDAVTETDRIKLAQKINAAERAIAERIILPTSYDVEEQAAIRDALRMLRILLDEHKLPAKADKHKDIA